MTLEQYNEAVKHAKKFHKCTSVMSKADFILFEAHKKAFYMLDCASNNKKPDAVEFAQDINRNYFSQN